MAGEMVVGDVVNVLTRLQDEGVILTGRSLQVRCTAQSSCTAWQVCLGPLWVFEVTEVQALLQGLPCEGHLH